MKKTSAQKVQLGILVSAALLIFIVAVYLIGNRQNLFQKSVPITAVFSNVNGLMPGNNVRYSGINVGTVRSLEMINDTVIKIHMAIDEKIIHHIKKDAIATIGSDGLVGNMIVNIIPGKGPSVSVQANDNIKSYSKIRTEDILSTLSVTNENAAILTANLLKITKEITQGHGTVGMLINDTTMANNLKETLSNLKMASERTNHSVASLQELLHSLQQENNVISLINSPETSQKIEQIIDRIHHSSGDIDSVITNLNSTILNIKEGDGLLNYLANNPDLVQEVDSTMKNVHIASERLNENLEALRHNFFFRRYFKKKEKEAKKQ